jgi:hypothetical protein
MMRTVIENTWPETIEELVKIVEDRIAEFPGWETYNKENGEQLYEQSGNLATEIGIAAFNYAAGKLGLSALQASVSAQNIYHVIFKDFQ